VTTTPVLGRLVAGEGSFRLDGPFEQIPCSVCYATIEPRTGYWCMGDDRYCHIGCRAPRR
jgi:hypothetical protein